VVSLRFDNGECAEPHIAGGPSTPERRGGRELTLHACPQPRQDYFPPSLCSPPRPLARQGEFPPSLPVAGPGPASKVVMGGSVKADPYLTRPRASRNAFALAPRWA
jgi:hypothetical protein